MNWHVEAYLHQGRAAPLVRSYRGCEIDRTGFYRGTAHKDSRSLMNITFRLASEDLEKQFVKESTAAGLDGLKGHRSVGGMRVSLYNAVTLGAVEALTCFMHEFQRTRG